MRKAIFIYNILSGARSVSRRLSRVIEKFQKSGIIVQPYVLDVSKQDALIKLIKDEYYDFVMVAGGDGSINFVVNILMKAGLDIPLGIIPAGTCNDFAKCINIPINFEDSLDVILKGHTKKVDVGLLNKERYFLSSYAGGGFASVSFKTDNELKKSIGAVAYYIKALSEVKNIKPFELRIKTSKQEINRDVILFFIANGKGIAGFSNVVKDASLTDGMMNIVLVKSCSNIDLMGLFFKLLNGTWEDDPNIIFIRTDKCSMNYDKTVEVTIDGEKGKSLPVDIEIINKGMSVFMRDFQ